MGDSSDVEPVTDEWRPDWRVPEEYAFQDYLNPDRWAWEFVRRNHEYADFWNEAETICSRKELQDAGFLPFEPLEKIPRLDLSPERGRECRRRWGFSPPNDPASSFPSISFVGRSGFPTPPAWLLRVEIFLDPRLGLDDGSWPSVMLAPIDLSLEIEPQIRFLELQARGAQKLLRLRPGHLQSKLQPSRWITYLRMLDAAAELFER